MSIRAFKYLSPITMYLAAFIALAAYGWLCYLPIIYGFIAIPLAELFLKPRQANLDAAEEEMAKKDNTYDYILYGMVLLQVPLVFYFLYHLQDNNLGWADIAGRIGSMGVLCGTFGINIGHELGHRVKPFEQWLAKLSLLTSLYMHFFIEHNKGHHKNVATPLDPSSARYGETLYAFWPRTLFFSYLDAWRIANDEAKKKTGRSFTLGNEMLQVHIIQLAFLAIVFLLFNTRGLICFGAAAFIGILLLETVNYIEHYGLTRKQIYGDKYERPLPQHSWNSNHVLGRIMLFELSRHSDHHYMASRKYQVLRHHEEAPQMPTGYPGMMLLSLVPPLWFYIMNKKLREMETDQQYATDSSVVPS
jgi:alkane 1-monooxygenase